MLFKNTRTGVVIDTPCSISGGDWIKSEDVDVSSEQKPELEAEEAETYPEPTDETDEPKTKAKQTNLTKKAIMQELDALGIKYDKKASTEELHKLMTQGE